MKFRAPLCLLMIALPLALVVAQESPTLTPAVPPAATPAPTPKKAKATPEPATPRPTILKRWLKALGIQKTSAGMTFTGYKGLDIALKIDPPQVEIGKDKELKVTVTLVNHDKKITQLDFPTSQRIEVLVKTKDGKTIEQWSEDQAFSNEPSLVTVNPNEKLQYVVTIPTRDMAVGETYTVQAFFPNFEQLRKEITITPVSPATPTPGKGAAAANKTPEATPTPPALDKKHR